MGDRTQPGVEALQGAEQLHRSERVMVLVRWGASLFALVQTLTFYKPYPAGMLPLALTVVVLMALSNVVYTFVFSRELHPARLKAWSVASLTTDVLLGEALVFVFAFDVETAIWAVLYILPLGGAIRFQLKGALWTTAAVAVLYTFREIMGSVWYDHEFLVTSVTFRMGIALMIAFVAGTSARNLVKERRAVQNINTELAALNQSMRDFITKASHDMRTPLAVIASGTRFVRENWASGNEEQKQKMLEAVERQAVTLDALIEGMLASSKESQNNTEGVSSTQEEGS